MNRFGFLHLWTLFSLGYDSYLVSFSGSEKREIDSPIYMCNQQHT
ncbi:hypothetical protein AtNW77_Chr5g0113251 [Arabidopsis thaliana]